jgi:hypothetical protein
VEGRSGEVGRGPPSSRTAEAVIETATEASRPTRVQPARRRQGGGAREEERAADQRRCRSQLNRVQWQCRSTPLRLLAQGHGGGVAAGGGRGSRRKGRRGSARRRPGPAAAP